MKTLTPIDHKKKAHLSVQLEIQEEAKIAFYERGLSALAEYDATGLHTTFSEMKTWAQDRKRYAALALPPCHE
jgi:hypothetical protein